MRLPLPPEFGPWSAARFHTVEARDQFLGVIATQPTTEVEVTPMPHESRAALVRWRPGHFLDLNDMAYSHGGRIILTYAGPQRGYDLSSSSVPARRSSRSMNHA